MTNSFPTRRSSNVISHDVINERESWRQVKFAQCIACPPNLAHGAIRVGERRRDRMTAPEAGIATLGLSGSMSSFHDCRSFPRTGIDRQASIPIGRASGWERVGQYV